MIGKGTKVNAFFRSLLEGGLPRINSLANEPKRPGYILFLAALACVFLARMRPAGRAWQLRWAAVGIFGISLMTFSGSYFAAVALFGVSVLLLYPSRTTLYVFGALSIALGVAALFPNLGVIEAIQNGYERRISEVEMGLDSTVAYRQEFFAWDYIRQNPLEALTGVGIGQYYAVLNMAYGVGAGYHESGSLMPISSNFLEVIFDLGVVAAVLAYGCLILLILGLRRAGETFFSISLLFLLAQSFSIITLLYTVLFAGFAMGRIVMRRRAAFQSKHRRWVFRNELTY